MNKNAGRDCFCAARKKGASWANKVRWSELHSADVFRMHNYHVVVLLFYYHPVTRDVPKTKKNGLLPEKLQKTWFKNNEK